MRHGGVSGEKQEAGCTGTDLGAAWQIKNEATHANSFIDIYFMLYSYLQTLVGIAIIRSDCRKPVLYNIYHLS
jgi:hypothetical protein